MLLGGKLCGGSACLESCGLFLTTSLRMKSFPFMGLTFPLKFQGSWDHLLRVTTKTYCLQQDVTEVVYRELAICSTRKIASNDNSFCQSLLDLIGKVKNSSISSLKSAHKSTLFHWLLFAKKLLFYVNDSDVSQSYKLHSRCRSFGSIFRYYQSSSVKGREDPPPKTKQTVSFHNLICLAYKNSSFSGCGQNAFLSEYIHNNYRVILTCIASFVQKFI